MFAGNVVKDRERASWRAAQSVHSAHGETWTACTADGSAGDGGGDEVAQKIQYTTALGNWNIEEELEQLEHIKKNHTKEDKQFILFNRAVVNMKQGESIDNVISMLLEAMRITCSRFDIDRTASVKLLTMDEILIISNIATALKAKGNLMQAIKWEYFLKEYMEN